MPMCFKGHWTMYMAEINTMRVVHFSTIPGQPLPHREKVRKYLEEAVEMYGWTMDRARIRSQRTIGLVDIT